MRLYFGLGMGRTGLFLQNSTVLGKRRFVTTSLRMEPPREVGISALPPEDQPLPRDFSLPSPTFGQVIIAGGDDEITPADLIDWVQPVLTGIPFGQWLTCELAPAGRGCLTTRIRRGAQVPHLALCSTIPRRQARLLCGLLPEAPPMAVILLNDHAGQAMALLDGLASWLNVYEADEPALAHIISLLINYAGASPQSKRAPRARPY
jgi:hypothetical protein